MKSYREWESDVTTVNLPHSSVVGSNAWFKNIKIGTPVKVRLHPNDPFPSIGWKVSKVTEDAVMVQKLPGSGGDVGNTAEGGIGGTLIIPHDLFIKMYLNDAPKQSGRYIHVV